MEGGRRPGARREKVQEAFGVASGTHRYNMSFSELDLKKSKISGKPRRSGWLLSFSPSREKGKEKACTGRGGFRNPPPLNKGLFCNNTSSAEKRMKRGTQ